MREASRELKVLFDGTCALCNGWVRFVQRHDSQNKFRFSSLNSPAARDELTACDISLAHESSPQDTMFLIEDGKLYDRSTAVLRLLRSLDPPLSWLYFFILIPKPIRDALYNFVARHRHNFKR